MKTVVNTSTVTKVYSHALSVVLYVSGEEELKFCQQKSRARSREKLGEAWKVAPFRLPSPCPSLHWKSMPIFFSLRTWIVNLESEVDNPKRLLRRHRNVYDDDEGTVSMVSIHTCVSFRNAYHRTPRRRRRANKRPRGSYFKLQYLCETKIFSFNAYARLSNTFLWLGRGADYLIWLMEISKDSVKGFYIRNGNLGE